MVFKIFEIWIVLVFMAGYSSELDVKLGMLSPFRHPRLGWENNAAAATIAVEKAQREGLLVGHNISVLWRDDRCSALGGTTGAMDFREENVDVLIGPPCSSSTIPTGLLAAYWNLPLFSQASSDPSLADKSVYKTLVRLGPPFNKMGKALVEFFKQYNWTSVVIISKRKQDNKNVFCDYSSRSVEDAFAQNNIEISAYIQINQGISDTEIDSVLSRADIRGRIILLCTEIIADRRRILLRAQEKGMTDPEYVYILPDHLPPANAETPWIQNNTDDHIAKQAFYSAFQISVAELAGQPVEDFRDLVSRKMADPPWSYNHAIKSGLRGSVYSAFLHDVVYLYLLVLNESLAEGRDYKNGTSMFEMAKGKSFRGMTGTVKVDDNGDREPDYWIWDLRPQEDGYQVTMEVKLTSSDKQKIIHHRPVIWGTKDGLPPPSTPRCGFSNELCPLVQQDKTLITSITISVAVVLLITLLMSAIFYKRARFERDLQLQLWKVNFERIKLKKTTITGSFSQISMQGAVLSGIGSTLSVIEDQVFTQIGVYDGIIVAVKRLRKSSIIIDRQEMLELKAMRELRHENVNGFLGMCVDERAPSILFNYCSKGSLEDIIENDDINLDWMFKVSLINDLSNGMAYIHSLKSTSLYCHGNLKSSNCLVDGRWVLKVSDYGLCRIRNRNKGFPDPSHRDLTGLFWQAPELLSNLGMRNGTQKGDVFAFGVVLFEILYRQLPYDTTLLTPLEIIDRVKVKEKPPFRPTSMLVHGDIDLGCDLQIRDVAMTLLQDCWADDIETRPSFGTIKRQVDKLFTGKRLGIVDNMVKMLEKYAVNLESIVETRTEQLVEEKKKTDTLLYRMLPSTVAEKLKTGNVVDPEMYDSVTIYFSDIVGFTALSSESTPMQVVDFLNDLYVAFDETIAVHDVYKVETIGDAYMVVSGLPVRNNERHSLEIANMSVDLLNCAQNFKIRHRPGHVLQLRIGVHTGSCVAGVVGRTMPRYCLFGDTVNTASRMESTGEAMRIHISQQAKDAIKTHGLFVIKSRGEIEIKGKGIQETYWLCGRIQDTSAA